MVEVARRTSTTTAIGADAVSAGVKTTSTFIRLRYFEHDGNCRQDLLPPPGSPHGSVLLGVWSPDLHGVHDDGAGRNPLPRARRRTAGRGPGADPERHGSGD